MTVADVMKIRNVTEARIAPDGSRVVYVISEVDFKEGVYNTDLWLVSAKGGDARRLTRGPRRDDSPRWSPDGKQIAFLSDRGGSVQVWLIAPDGGEARKLTDSKTLVKSFAWAPDCKRIAYLAPDPDTEEEALRKRDRSDVQVVGQGIKMNHLHLLDLDGNEARRLTGGTFDVANFSWAPDGSRIAYAARPSPQADDGQHADIHVLDVAAGKSKPLVERPGLDTLPKWSPDGKRIAFVSSDGSRDRLANTVLCVVPTEGGKPRNVSGSFDGRIDYGSDDVFHWQPDGERLFFTADQKTTRQLFSVTVDGGKVRPETAAARVHDHFTFSRDGAHLAFVAEDPATPREVYLSPSTEMKPQRLTHTNPQLDEIALGAVEVVRWKSKDGMDIEGLLVKPVGFQEGKRVPLLVYAHGGPALRFGRGFSLYPPGPPQASRYPLHVLAGQGYAIFCPNPRGSDGYGLKFRVANVKDWGGGDFQDIMSGLDALIERGLADPDRLGVMGWSYGGFMTAWTITHTNRFKAASAGAGVMDLFCFYGQTDIPTFLERYFDGVPWRRRELYFKHSPMSYVGNVKTPTLIQHGGSDERVPLAQSKELYAALKRRKVPVELVIYPRQPHNPTEPRLQQDVLQRNVDWFNRWLKK
jgi:dipeptidyl aminopeptidase/acylaminoacyl peptidase